MGIKVTILRRLSEKDGNCPFGLLSLQISKIKINRIYSLIFNTITRLMEEDYLEFL
jgi:hypothetical protein